MTHNTFIQTQAIPASVPATTEAEDRRLVLHAVVREGAAVLELLASEDEALLIRRDALLVLDLCLDVLDGVGADDLKCDGLCRSAS